MLKFALISFLSLLAVPAFAETPAAAPAAAPVVAPAPTVEAPKVEAPKVDVVTPDAVKVEAPKAEAAKPTEEKHVGKMRERWKKMTPEQREEMRKKAEGRLNERYDRLKTAEQETIKKIMGEIGQLTKEQRSILMAKIRQQAHKERVQRKKMKDMDAGKKEPAVDPNKAAQH